MLTQWIYSKERFLERGQVRHTSNATVGNPTVRTSASPCAGFIPSAALRVRWGGVGAGAGGRAGGAPAPASLRKVLVFVAAECAADPLSLSSCAADNAAINAAGNGSRTR